jgi:hypothetical protein
MVTITTYLINYVNYETNEALLYENRYLVSINVFKQLNETLPSIIQNEACTLISNPINYTCETLGINTTDIIANVLGIISNRTGSIVHYEIMSYGVYGSGNETIYRATIIAMTQDDEIEGMVSASYPINLCLYSQAIKDLMNNLRANLTVYANNITEAIQIVNRDVSNRVELLGDKYVKITIYMKEYSVWLEEQVIKQPMSDRFTTRYMPHQITKIIATKQRCTQAISTLLSSSTSTLTKHYTPQ